MEEVKINEEGHHLIQRQDVIKYFLLDNLCEKNIN